MKKLFTLIAVCFLTTNLLAQITNPGMEAPWRTNTSGGEGLPPGPVFTVQAPYGWYGLDSLVIADGETFGSFIGAGNNWHRQVFQDSTHVHSGSYAARIETHVQDTLGELSGILANCKTSIDVAGILGGGNLLSSTSYSGGTYVTQRMTHVNAWVEYFTPGGNGDSGTVQVIASINVGGVDSVVGTGSAFIDFDTTNFTQVSAAIQYNDPNVIPDTIRIFFASSASEGGGVDSSVLYVDDVSMDTLGLSVPNTLKQNNIVTVYPNPTTGIVHVANTTNEPLTWKAFSMNGQQVSEKSFTGNKDIDLSSLPDGIYFYDLRNNSNVIVQRGKVSVVK